MKKLIVLTVMLVFSFASFSQSVCDQILKQGVFDYYEVRNETSFDYMFKKLILMTKDELEYQIQNRSVGFDISIPLAEAFLDFAFSSSNTDEKYRRLKEMYMNNQEATISSTEKTWLVQRFANKSIVSAWEKCVTNPQNVFWELKGDPKKEFSVSISYKPNESSSDRKLNGVAISSSVSKKGNNVFYVGKPIKRFDSYTQLFSRKDSNAVVITLNISGIPKPLSIELPAIPKPFPIYRVEWFKTDPSGKPYYAEHSFVSEDHHHDDDCCGAIREGRVTLEQLGVKKGRIYNVEYVCQPTGDGNYCGWSYNPQGGYAKDVSISPDGKSFLWRRNWDGKPVKEVYNVYYEVERGICVKNCEDKAYFTK